MVIREPPATEPDELVAGWVHDLLCGSHPTFGAGDFTIVEEAATNRIVSAMNLISQELDLRWDPVRRGPARAGGHGAGVAQNTGWSALQFEVIHAISAERGELVQAITGIPNYYRQFGYEMTMRLGGGRQATRPTVAKLKEGEVEPFRLRPPVEPICPWSWSWTDAARQNLVYCPRDALLWRYELWGKSEKNGDRLDWFIVESADSEAISL